MTEHTSKIRLLSRLIGFALTLAVGWNANAQVTDPGGGVGVGVGVGLGVGAGLSLDIEFIPETRVGRDFFYVPTILCGTQ